MDFRKNKKKSFFFQFFVQYFLHFLRKKVVFNIFRKNDAIFDFYIFIFAKQIVIFKILSIELPLIFFRSALIFWSAEFAKKWCNFWFLYVCLLRCWVFLAVIRTNVRSWCVQAPKSCVLGAKEKRKWMSWKTAKVSPARIATPGTILRDIIFSEAMV